MRTLAPYDPMGFAPTWLRQVSPPPLLHKTTLTTEHAMPLVHNVLTCRNPIRVTNKLTHENHKIRKTVQRDDACSTLTIQ